MKKQLLYITGLAFLFVLLAAANTLSAETECTIPKSGMHISADTVICGGYYEISSIAIDSPAALDCSGAIFEGELNKNGLIINSNNAEIKNCNFISYKKAITLNEISSVLFENVLLRDNVIGLYSIGEEASPHGITFEGNEQDVYYDKRNNAEKSEMPAQLIPKKTYEEYNLKVYNIKNIVNEKIVRELRINPAKMANSRLEITKKLEVSSEGSTFTVLITPKKEGENILGNLLVYEHVPKEIAESAAEIEFIDDKNLAVVVNNDPDFLIPIGKLKIKTTAEIKYRVKKKITKEEAEKEMPSTVVVEEDEENNEEEGIAESLQEELAETAAESSDGLSKLKPKTRLPLVIVLAVLTLATIIAVYRIEKRKQ